MENCMALRGTLHVRADSARTVRKAVEHVVVANRAVELRLEVVLRFVLKLD